MADKKRKNTPLLNEAEFVNDSIEKDYEKDENLDKSFDTPSNMDVNELLRRILPGFMGDLIGKNKNKR